MNNRDQFKEWAKERGLDISEHKVTDFMAFHDMNTEMRWSAWCASAQREGYKLVPVEPTTDMWWEGKEELQNNGDATDIYKAMIGAVNDH